jgi:hypothetical protein
MVLQSCVTVAGTEVESDGELKDGNCCTGSPGRASAGSSAMPNLSQCPKVSLLRPRNSMKTATEVGGLR